MSFYLSFYQINIKFLLDENFLVFLSSHYHSRFFGIHCNQNHNKTNENMSCARPPNFLLRKQKSLVCESVCQPTMVNSGRRFRLHKQFSVDQHRDKFVNGQMQIKNGHTNINNSWGCNNSSPDPSLRIFTAIKNKTQNECEPTSNECVFSF